MRTTAVTASILLGSALLAPTNAGASGDNPTNVIYVRPDAQPGGNGASWASAFTHLEQALQAAPSRPAVDQIWVAGGIYTPVTPIIPSDPRTRAFTLVNGVTIYGGLLGAEPTLPPSHVRLANPPTVLTGDLNGDDGPNFTNRADNVLVVVRAAGVAVTLDGVTIRGGNNAGGSLGDVGGGLLIHEGASVSLRHCRVTDNLAQSFGAGAYLGFNSRLRALNTLFVGNRTLGGAGAGVALFGAFAPGTLSAAAFTNCLFVANSAPAPGATGGGVFSDGATLTLTNSVVFANTCDATFGAGVHITGLHGQPHRVQNSVLWSNLAGGSDSYAAQLAAMETLNGLIYSNVQNFVPPVGLPNVGNFSADPNFRDPDGADGALGTLDDDFALAVDSPCIDAGVREIDTDISTPQLESLPAFDITGFQPRVAVGLPTDIGERPDMGVYEIQPLENVYWIGDNGFGTLNTADNWYGGALPRAFDPTVFALPGAYDLYLDGPLTVGTMSLDTGEATLALTDSFFLSRENTTALHPALGVDGDGSLTVIGVPRGAAGAHLEADVVTVGLDGPGGLTFSTPGAALRAGELHVGLGADGDVFINQGASAEIARRLEIADGAAGSVFVETGATLDVAPGTETVIARSLGSSGQLAIDSGAAASIAGDSLAVGLGGHGALWVGNGATLHTSLTQGVALGLSSGAIGEAIVFNGATWTDNGPEPIRIGAGPGAGRGLIELYDPGAIVALGGVEIAPRSRLTGDGALTGDVLNTGVVEPALFPPALSRLTVNGDFTQFRVQGQSAVESGALRVFAVAPGAENHTGLVVNGQANLGGGLFVSLGGGYLPIADAGADITALRASSITGAFSVAYFPGFPDTRFMRLSYRDIVGDAGPASVAVVSTEVLPTTTIYGPPQTFPAPGQPNWGVLADLDGDGDQDLAVTIPDLTPTMPGALAVLFNAGNDGMGEWLGFSSTIQLPSGVNPVCVIAAQLDANPGIDLAVANSDDDTISFYLNDGAGSFTRIDTPSAGDEPIRLGAGDFDNAFGDDLAVLHRASNEVVILLNDGLRAHGFGGRFPCPPGDPTALATGDLDEDKDLDITATGTATGADGLSSVGSVSVFRNIGFTFPRTDFTTGDGPRALVLADLDLDGDTDVATADDEDGAVSILLNTGVAGTLAPAVSLPVGVGAPSLAAADTDGDNDTDLAVVTTVNTDGSSAVVQTIRNDLSNAQLGFSPAAQLFAGLQPTFVATADVNNDGVPDVVSINNSTLDGGDPNPIAVQLSQLLIPGDVNFDGVVDMYDLNIVLCEWAMTGQNLPSDINHNGVVDFTDLNILLSNFGMGQPL